MKVQLNVFKRLLREMVYNKLLLALNGPSSLALNLGMPAMLSLMNGKSVSCLEKSC